MKIACSVSIGNRTLTNLGMINSSSSRRKHIKSTLALCKHPNTDEFYIILFTQQNKNGTKYLIKGNIIQILTRFINDGKATIQFKQPPHDFYIQCDEIIQLKSFLHLLKRTLENKKMMTSTTNQQQLLQTYSSLSVTPIATKDLPIKKMVIKDRSEYPSNNCFPRTLESLYINNIQCCSIEDCGILKLIKLKILDLSNNRIEYLPEELNKLPNLTTLNLGSNQFGKSSPKQWNWIGGNLLNSLTYLNLELNNLQFLPDEIVKLQKLITLNMNNNLLKSLPHGIGNLKNLMNLNVSNNQLTKLPSTARLLHLTTFELSNNNLQNVHRHTNATIQTTKLKLIKHWPICTLRELSGKIILKSSIKYNCNIIPKTLVYYLDHAKYCICGQACFNVYYQIDDQLALSDIAQNFCISSSSNITINDDDDDVAGGGGGGVGNYHPIVLIDAYFCSLKCLRLRRGRNRQPII